MGRGGMVAGSSLLLGEDTAVDRGGMVARGSLLLGELIG